MNLRYLALLFLFLFNFSATVYADSIHFDLPSISNEKIAHEGHISTNATDADEDEHCTNHDCCHQNHIHYYLLPLVELSFSSYSEEYNFPEYTSAVLNNYSDVIKPPLV